MYKILIIEDQPSYKRILKDTFEKEKFKVISASDGKSGIMEAAKSRPDFILLDIMLLGMSGTAVLKSIRNIDELKSVPIAILTVVPDGVPQKYEKREVFSGIVGYWVKDESPLSEIVNKVKGYLGNKSIYIN